MELVAHNIFGSQSPCQGDSPSAAVQGLWQLSDYKQAILYIMYGVIGITISPIITVGSELIIDWIKHAFMLRLNKMDITIYDSFIFHISNNINLPDNVDEKKDLPQTSTKDSQAVTENTSYPKVTHHLPNMSARAARIIEFIPFPLACLIASTSMDTLKTVSDIFMGPGGVDASKAVALIQSKSINADDDLIDSANGDDIVSAGSLHYPSNRYCSGLKGSGIFTYPRGLKVLLIVVLLYILLFCVKLQLNRLILTRAKHYIKVASPLKKKS